VSSEDEDGFSRSVSKAMHCMRSTNLLVSSSKRRQVVRSVVALSRSADSNRQGRPRQTPDKTRSPAGRWRAALRTRAPAEDDTPGSRHERRARHAARGRRAWTQTFQLASRGRGARNRFVRPFFLLAAMRAFHGARPAESWGWLGLCRSRLWTPRCFWRMIVVSDKEDGACTPSVSGSCLVESPFKLLIM
jgi:hypothetical protein